MGGLEAFVIPDRARHGRGCEKLSAKMENFEKNDRHSQKLQKIAKHRKKKMFKNGSKPSEERQPACFYSKFLYFLNFFRKFALYEKMIKITIFA